MRTGLQLLWAGIFLLSFVLSWYGYAAEPPDPDRYIGIDEIKPGMDAYCLTAYKGSEVEKFGLEVLSVVRNISPGHDAIIVKGTDKRFLHTGPVAGCSGSPVFIENRLAGALAFGWLYSKDPLYGVTPIAEMLAVTEEQGREGKNSGKPAFAMDFSKPLELTEVYSKVTSLSKKGRELPHQAVRLPFPIVTSGLAEPVCSRLNQWVEPFGFMAVSGAAAVNTSQAEGTDEIVPGSPLSVPLATGDITMAAIGTATEVQGDKVYAFGHSFLGYGPLELPMGAGHIHTVVSNVVRSFKLGSATKVVGALSIDKSTAVFGRLGQQASMIPVTITVDRYNDPQRRTYNCHLADNQILTPLLLHAALGGAAYMQGDFPPDHKVEYQVEIGFEGFEPIRFRNMSTCTSISEVSREAVATVAILMNNPYKRIQIKSLDFGLRITPDNVLAEIWSVNVADTEVKAGDTISLEVVVESYLARKKKYEFSFVLPAELAAGKYKLTITGPTGYEDFLRKSAPYRFMPENMETLVEALRTILSVKRDRLYCVLELPPGGLALEQAELPDLPATKALILADEKRTLMAHPYHHYKEKSVETGSLILDRRIIPIEVKDNRSKK